VAAALLAAEAVGVWALSTTITANAMAFEVPYRAREAATRGIKALPHRLLCVTGTDSDGKRYAAPGIVGIAVSPWHHPALLSRNGIMVSRSALAKS
jgi:hypothetical protein